MALDTQILERIRTGAPSRVLVVDDERSMRELLSIVLKRDGHDVLTAEDGNAAVDLLRRERVDILITDIRMPNMTGVEVLRAAREIDPDIISIVMTAFASTDTAVEVLRDLGAADYVNKSPTAVNEVRLRVRKELERRQLQQENALLKRAMQASHHFSNIIGNSSAMLTIFQMIETIAPTSSTVLLSGESGTGKELVARAIHVRSARSERPFVALNCGALPETLLDSELFGHMRGAFTGADTNKKGLIEVAGKGTIFLDEIGEMSPMVQIKLLRVLQERKFRRLGGTEEVDADIRIVAATNRDLARMVAEGAFREDLYYRINVIPVRLPPLREREDGHPQVAGGALRREICRGDEEGRHRHLCWGPRGAPGAPLARKRSRARERHRASRRAGEDRDHPRTQPPGLRASLTGRVALGTSVAQADGSLLPEAGFDLEQHVQRMERHYLAEALKQAAGVKVKAAERLGLSFRQFRYLLKKYDLK